MENIVKFQQWTKIVLEDTQKLFKLNYFTTH